MNKKAKASLLFPAKRVCCLWENEKKLGGFSAIRVFARVRKAYLWKGYAKERMNQRGKMSEVRKGLTRGWQEGGRKEGLVTQIRM